MAVFLKAQCEELVQGHRNSHFGPQGTGKQSAHGQTAGDAPAPGSFKWRWRGRRGCAGSSAFEQNVENSWVRLARCGKQMQGDESVC